MQMPPSLAPGTGEGKFIDEVNPGSRIAGKTASNGRLLIIRVKLRLG